MIGRARAKRPAPGEGERAMGRSARIAAALLGGFLLAGPARPVALADEPVVDEPAFLACLGQARACLAGGRAGEGLKIVDAALEQHKGKDYVFGKRPELEDLVHRLAFRAECPPPEAKSVVKGDLRKFISMSGDLEIHYPAGKPHDFETRSDGLAFPARFRGPFTITIKGNAYPSTTDAAPIVELGMEINPKTRRPQGWAIAFGVPPYQQGSQQIWLPARILAVDGDQRKMVVEKATSPARPGKPYRLDAGMTSRNVTASIDGVAFGTAPKPEGVFGYAIVRASGWSEIVVAGQVEPSWIQSKIDAIVDGKRKAFDAKFDLRTRLPAWLYEKRPSAAPAASARPRVPAGLRNLPPALLPDYMEAMTKLARGDARGALADAEALRGKGAPDSVTGVLAARAHLALEEPTLALPEADRALSSDPDAFDAFLLKGMILLGLGRDQDLVATLKAATARPEAGGEVFEGAGRFLLRAGRLDDARAVAEDAARRGLRSPLLETIGRVVVRAQNGPDWPKTYEYKTNDYHVVSDIDLETCRRAAIALEDALLEFRAHVRPLKPDAKRLYKVFLFSGEAGFKRYVEDSVLLDGKGPERPAGLYSGVLKQLLIWNLPNRDEMMRTIRHEGFHQYLDRLLPDPPVWLNEGMAVYFEGMVRVAGSLKLDTPRPDLLETLKGRDLVPAEKFLKITPKEFYATSPHSYAQAWLTVHMMRHGVVKYRELFYALLNRLETASGAEAVRAVVDPATLPAFDADLRAYLVTLSNRK